MITSQNAGFFFFFFLHRLLSNRHPQDPLICERENLITLNIVKLKSSAVHWGSLAGSINTQKKPKIKAKKKQQQQQTNNKNNKNNNKKNLAWTVAVWAVSFEVARVRRLQRACFQEILALTWALRLLKRVTLWSSPSAGMRCDCPGCEVWTRVVIWFMKTTWEEPRKIHLVTRLMIPRHHPPLLRLLVWPK